MTMAKYFVLATSMSIETAFSNTSPEGFEKLLTLRIPVPTSSIACGREPGMRTRARSCFKVRIGATVRVPR